METYCESFENSLTQAKKAEGLYPRPTSILQNLDQESVAVEHFVIMTNQIHASEGLETFFRVVIET